MKSYFIDDDRRTLSNFNPIIRHNVHTLSIVGLVAFWYITAVITISSSKQIMNKVSSPFLLCTVQFTCASVGSLLYLYIAGPFKSPHKIMHTIIIQIAISYTLGFILTNLAFSIVTAAFAETIKSTEPVSTILIGLVLFHESSSFASYLSLIPICLGVAISCYKNDSFNSYGFILAIGSNIGFSMRAVLAKKMVVMFPESYDEQNLFALISIIGVIILIPITFILEGRTIIQLLFNIGDNNIMFADTNKSNTLLSLLPLLLLNGSMFTCYNLTSYIILKRIDLLNHAVLNCFRRVFIIISTSYYFNIPISSLNVIGILIAIMGIILYAYAKSSEKSKGYL